MEAGKDGISDGFEYELTSVSLVFSRGLALNHPTMKLAVSVLLLGAIFSVSAYSQARMSNSKRLKIVKIDSDFEVTALNSAVWDKALDVSTGKYWSGLAAPETRHFTVRLLWSDTAIYIRFESRQAEPLVVSDKPDLTVKTNGLWDRDVCEIFIAPDKNDRNRYFEFEIAPTGEWVDLGIKVNGAKRETDWEYKSGMKSAAFIEKEKIVMAIKVEWKAFGKAPRAGEIWLGNLFRCVGKDPTRGYLSWQPTRTKAPSFHVPSKFGEFEFVK